jgi:hypothetical protein
VHRALCAGLAAALTDLSAEVTTPHAEVFVVEACDRPVISKRR